MISFFFSLLIYLYIYAPDSQESDEDANTSKHAAMSALSANIADIVMSFGKNNILFSKSTDVLGKIHNFVCNIKQ